MSGNTTCTEHLTGPVGKEPAETPRTPGKQGWKWPIAADRDGIPIGWAIDGANRHDMVLLGPTLDNVTARGLTVAIETLHIDRGYDGPAGPAGSPSLQPGSTTRSAHANANEVPPRNRSPHPSGCDGPLNAPTRGSRTTDSSAETPTDASSTASPSAPSPSPSSSPSNSSNGQNDGTNDPPICAGSESVFLKAWCWLRGGEPTAYAGQSVLAGAAQSFGADIEACTRRWAR